MLKKNQIITLEITSITNLGFGVGRADGVVVFVSGTVPEDIVEVKIIKVASSFAVGRVEKFIKKSALRGRLFLFTILSNWSRMIIYNVGSRNRLPYRKADGLPKGCPGMQPEPFYAKGLSSATVPKILPKEGLSHDYACPLHPLCRLCQPPA